VAGIAVAVLLARVAAVVVLRQGIAIDHLQTNNILIEQAELRLDDGLALRITELGLQGTPCSGGPLPYRPS
jgi:hypothetical protein